MDQDGAMPTTRTIESAEATMRLDKWLWTARFFKTRQLASEAITGGKVHLNGQRTKPGKDVRPGSRVRIHKGSLEWDIVVEKLSTQRRPAAEAVLLYRETDESHRKRQQLVESRRLDRDQAGRPPGRPGKRDRRLIRRFTEEGNR